MGGNLLRTALCGTVIALVGLVAALPVKSFVVSANPQTVTVTGTSGTFTLTFSGQTTGPLPFSATASQVQTALMNLSNVGMAGGTVTVTQAGDVYAVTFGGTLTAPQPLMIGVGSGGAGVTVSVVRRRQSLRDYPARRE